jgi:pyruvate/2-oxoglutarate dehydrogenase complex dihydrolipoamide dehydrogenase (E3) component
VVTPDDDLVVLTAGQAVVLCTGSRAALPDVPGIAEARPWTNRKATDSSEIPRRLAVVGGGPLGVEMATAWQGLGSSVTVLARDPRLLPRLEPFVGGLVKQGLSEVGVSVRVGVSVSELRRPAPDDPVTLYLDDDTDLEVDEVLFATGREPNTSEIGLETVGLTPGAWQPVETSAPAGPRSRNP